MSLQMATPASPVRQGKFPFWGQALMRHYIRPAAVKVDITKRIGWHTFRHSYSTLLKASGADIKVMQELLRHASTRVTLDTYTQAVTRRSEQLKPRLSDSSFQLQRRLRKRPPKLRHELLRKVVPFCAYEF
jgi:integrase